MNTRVSLVCLSHTILSHCFPRLYRSITSELSDLPDADYHRPDPVEFDEEMKTVFDVAHPDLTVPQGGETIPTHLYPYHGSGLRKRSHAKSSKSNIHRRGLMFTKGIDCIQ
jgi:hypothetical protein|mmetsp:Transcript_18997/g.29254  ORF Transcript_18997/g.29254 Transcript_18997/m.29254 type:complete len:111 (+) Transcript_18997:1848-2180(+)